MRKPETSEKIIDGWGSGRTEADQPRQRKTRGTVNICLQIIKQVSQLWKELTSFLCFKNIGLKSEISRMFQENTWRMNKRMKTPTNGGLLHGRPLLRHYMFLQSLGPMTPASAMNLTLSREWSSITPEPNPLAQKPNHCII